MAACIYAGAPGHPPPTHLYGGAQAGHHRVHLLAQVVLHIHGQARILTQLLLREYKRARVCV
jgi:hypothetical protein